MLLTEKEAGGKTCCAPAWNASGRHDCEASECMAWRWAVDPRGEPVMKKEGDEYRETGYCGLAGPPDAT